MLKPKIMTLQKDQIECLFEFTRRHGVQYYDVQAELVDHLASQIEADMDANPALAFHAALDEAYTKFGPKGFKFIEDHRAEAVYVRYEALWSKEAKQWATLKNLFLLFLIGLAGYLLGTVIDPSWRLHIVVGAFAVLHYFQLTKAAKQQKEAKKKLLILKFLENKKWSAIVLDAIIINLTAGDWFSVPVAIVAIGVLFFFVSRISTHRVHLRMTLRVQNEYPEAFT
jgi:hypothetical protein